jgi:hypothetical protein
MINTSGCKHDSMISRGVCRAGYGATYDHLPDSGWAVLTARPVAQDREVSPRSDCAAKGGGDHNHPWRGLGRTFLLALIIFVVTTAAARGDRKRMVNEAASASVPLSKRELSGAIPQAS